MSLGAWYSPFLMSKAEKEAAVRQYFADMGDYDRLFKVWIQGVAQLGNGHPDVRDLGSALNEIGALSKRQIWPEIDRTIARLASEGKWPYRPLTFEEWYNGSSRDADYRGLTGWILAAVIVLLAGAIALSVFDPFGTVRAKTIVAKAKAVAIVRETEARAKAIEEGRTPAGSSVLDPGNMLGVDINIDWKILALAGAVVYFLSRRRRSA
jgi:hypothetical protein